ncbi:hypothetical protein [Mesorhizobium shangrilense]|uniref:DUF680 domain-containing protein n=1 Tax=Mesorhizobium shangrilense TaxID=460060 RepID=A0ABV2D608_9HYPH
MFRRIERAPAEGERPPSRWVPKRATNIGRNHLPSAAVLPMMKVRAMMKKTLTLVIAAQAAAALALLLVATFELTPGPAVAAQTATAEKTPVRQTSADDCSKATWPNIPQHCLDNSSGAGRTVSAVVVIPDN